MSTKCGLCDHEITFEHCGSAEADGVKLCHHETHSCYHQWTVYKKRPGRFSGGVNRSAVRAMVRMKQSGRFQNNSNLKQGDN